MQGAWVWSLVGELRSHMLCSTAKNKIKKKKNLTEKLEWTFWPTQYYSLNPGLAWEGSSVLWAKLREMASGGVWIHDPAQKDACYVQRCRVSSPLRLGGSCQLQADFLSSPPGEAQAKARELSEDDSFSICKQSLHPLQLLGRIRGICPHRHILAVVCIRSHHFMANRWGNNGNSYRLYFLGLQNHCRWWLQPWN